jgi:hypothetical protein
MRFARMSPSAGGSDRSAQLAAANRGDFFIAFLGTRDRAREQCHAGSHQSGYKLSSFIGSLIRPLLRLK